jgi:hypothetical protein
MSDGLGDIPSERKEFPHQTKRFREGITLYLYLQFDYEDYCREEYKLFQRGRERESIILFISIPLG